MKKTTRHGKANPMLVAIVPPLIFVVGLMLYSVFKWAAPSPFTIDKVQTVEAIEVIGKISPTTKNGLLIPQAASLRAGGSSRVVVSRPHDRGAFFLVSGFVSAGFIQEKNPLDGMLRLKFGRDRFYVESGGERVDAMLLVPRDETNPLYVDVPNVEVGIDPMTLLFPGDSIGPQPAGILYTDKFESDNGMSIVTTIAIGQSGMMGMAEVPQFNFKLDPSSSGWVEAPRNISLQHKAVGTEDLGIALLIPLESTGDGPLSIVMFGEEVATVSR
jgi:hypothetical protein